jgi:hypothetical protein
MSVRVPVTTLSPDTGSGIMMLMRAREDPLLGEPNSLLGAEKFPARCGEIPCSIGQGFRFQRPNSPTIRNQGRWPSGRLLQNSLLNSLLSGNLDAPDFRFVRYLACP